MKRINKLMFRKDKKVLVLLLGISILALLVHGSSASTDCDGNGPWEHRDVAS